MRRPLGVLKDWLIGLAEKGFDHLGFGPVDGAEAMRAPPVHLGFKAINLAGRLRAHDPKTATTRTVFAAARGWLDFSNLIKYADRKRPPLGSPPALNPIARSNRAHAAAPTPRAKCRAT